MTEGQARQKVVGIMQGWVGLKRSDKSHKPIIDTYNQNKPLPRNYKVTYTDAYCATTVSAAAILAGYTDIMPIECSCYYLIEQAKKMGIWQENDAYIPKMGDEVLYDWQDGANYGVTDNQGTPDHVGMIESVQSNKIVVIEGNMNGGVVGRRTIQVNGRYIRGYITPKYYLKVDQKTESEHKKTIEDIAEEVLAGKWGNSPDRKAKLEAAGYDYSEVQAAVNRLSGVKPVYYPACNKRFTTISTALASIKVDNSFAFRKKIAKVNHIEGYTGTAAQNKQMLNLLREGCLIKA